MNTNQRDDSADAERFARRIKAIAEELLDDGADRGEMKLISRALEELRLSFRTLRKYRGRRKVTMFGSARTPADDPRYQQAVEFGRKMADAGFMVITGAGPGIMEAGHVGAGLENSIGLNITLPFEQSANSVIHGDEKLFEFNYFFTRKLLFLKEADAIVLFPGGFGTLDEGFEVLTLLQTGKAVTIPFVMLDVPGGDYWERFRDYLHEGLYANGMISEEDFSLFRITHSVDEAVDEISRFYDNYHSQRYIRGRLSLRLRREPSDALLERIRSEFADIAQRGDFRVGTAHAHEANEPHVAHLPRLHFHFDRRAFGRLRQLIDLLNREG